MKLESLLLAMVLRHALRRPGQKGRHAREWPAIPTDDEVIDAIRRVPAHFATTYAYSGHIDLNAFFTVLFGGDTTGSETGALTLQSIDWGADGGTAPTVSGWVHAAAVAAASGNWLIADPDPFQAMGDAIFSPGFTMGTTHKVKLFAVINSDLVNSATIINGASAGTTLFDGTASHGVTVEPGGIAFIYDPNGTRSGALTTTSNDKMTVSVSGGAPSLEVLIAYGL